MKKIYLIIAGLVIVSGLKAQPWISNSGKPEKLKDIISAYQSHPFAGEAKDDEDEPASDNPKLVKEGKDYQFSRWVWYWQQHLDKDGYLASPLRTFNEWRAYQKGANFRGHLAKTTNSSQWTFLGPTHSPGEYSGLGRINVIAFHPTDTNTYIVGTAGGGAWRTINGGVNWTSLYDDLPVLGVSDVVYNPLNPNTIFLCTGDRDAGDTYSVGLLKSNDGGATWDTTGLHFDVVNTVLICNLIINPLDTNSMMVATNQGIWKSPDGGANWAYVLPGNFKQVVYNTADTSIVYAAGNGTQTASNIYRSTDGGQNWQMVTNLTQSRAIRLAVTKADPSVVKLVATTSSYGLLGIYSSTDSGASFVKVYGDPNDCSTNILSGSNTPDNTTCDGQAWYDLTIAISPVDTNTVVVGGVNTWFSGNGGYAWSIATQWWSQLPAVKTVHADKHYLVYHPLKPSTLFECNDGGIYRTASPLSTIWDHLTNGMGITQFYRNAVADNASFVLGGAQDNGTKRINTLTAQASDETGGDGMDCQIDYDDTHTYYTSSQFGSFSRTLNDGFVFSDISQNIPGNQTGEWITPMQINPQLHNIIMIGYAHLWLSQDKGNNWSDVSPGFTTSNIRRIAMSASDAEAIYILKNDNTLRYTPDLGANWNIITMPFSGEYVTDIQADPKDAGHLWVTFGGYTGNKVADYRPSSGWQLHNQGLPNIPIACMVIDSSNGTQYIGTDVSVFYKDSTMSNWALYSNGLPNIEVTDMGINYSTNEIWASTYGRGMWSSPRYMNTTSIPTLPLALDVITVSPNPSNGKFIVSTENKALLDQPVELKIIGISGNISWKTTVRFNGGKLSIDAAQLSKGSYILK